MADAPRPSGGTADGEHADPSGPEHRPRHLRVDERRPVRDLDAAQLAAEALMALRAEHRPPFEPERVGIVPWDPPSGPPAVAGPDGAAGRHRAGDRATVVAPGTRVAGAGRPSVAAPDAGPATPVPSASRADQILATARSGHPRRDGAPAPVRGRSWRTRSLPMAVAAAVLAGLGVVAFLLVRSAGDTDPPAGGPVTSVAPPAPTVDGSASADPATTGPTTRTSAATTDASVSGAGVTASGGNPPSGTGEVATTAGAAPTAAPNPARTTPAPAVLSTLASDDDGFGWPSTAFGQPR